MFLLLTAPLLLVGAIWLAYLPGIHGAWLIDDVEGIATYDGKLQKPLRWHAIFKWLRWRLGARPNPDQDWKKKNHPAWIQAPEPHHRFSLIVFSGCAVLLFWFLDRFLGPQKAFLATLLFIFHPIGSQPIGWISGIGYLVGLFFMLTGLVLVPSLSTWATAPWQWAAALALYAFCQWMAVEAMFVTTGAAAVLLWLGHWPFGLVALALAGYGALTTLTDALKIRTKTFIEQDMGATTIFHWRKLIVMVKTLGYYLCLSCWPSKLGLYHTYGYHYPLPYIEAEDRRFWFGVACLLGLILALVFGPPIVQLAIVWYVAFLLLFLNAVTANQFLTERYAWIASFAVCILAAVYLPAWAFWMACGLGLMRIWAQLPAYQDRLRFYLYNYLNFPRNEIALGNLGVEYMNAGMIGSAIDAWTAGLKCNPEYDVCWYNLSSLLKSRGTLPPQYAPITYDLAPFELMREVFEKKPQDAHLYMAHFLLKRALESRTCHFKQKWKWELFSLEFSLKPGLPPLLEPLVV